MELIDVDHEEFMKKIYEKVKVFEPELSQLGDYLQLESTLAHDALRMSAVQLLEKGMTCHYQKPVMLAVAALGSRPFLYFNQDMLWHLMTEWVRSGSWRSDSRPYESTKFLLRILTETYFPRRGPIEYL
jgi:hypothetical protein